MSQYVPSKTTKLQVVSSHIPLTDVNTITALLIFPHLPGFSSMLAPGTYVWRSLCFCASASTHETVCIDDQNQHTAQTRESWQVYVEFPLQCLWQGSNRLKGSELKHLAHTEMPRQYEVPQFLYLSIGWILTLSPKFVKPCPSFLQHIWCKGAPRRGRNQGKRFCWGLMR